MVDVDKRAGFSRAGGGGGLFVRQLRLGGIYIYMSGFFRFCWWFFISSFSIFFLKFRRFYWWSDTHAGERNSNKSSLQTVAARQWCESNVETRETRTHDTIILLICLPSDKGQHELKL